jgi:hypothetical protein
LVYTVDQQNSNVLVLMRASLAARASQLLHTHIKMSQWSGSTALSVHSAIAPRNDMIRCGLATAAGLLMGPDGKQDASI